MKLEGVYKQVRDDVRATLADRKTQKLKRLIIGQNVKDGVIAKLIIIALLTVIGFLYVKPILYMISTSLKSVADMIDPVVGLIPRELNLDNYKDAWKGLNYLDGFADTMTIALLGSIFQVFTCALTGYALARLKFPGKNLFFFLILIAFLIPPQLTIVPLYMIYSELGWINTPFVFLIPAIFGQGLRGALFIIIFRQFFHTQPKALEEAAKIDGASVFRLFFRIMMPLATGACLVVFLFSFVWYWNMSYEAALFLSKDFTPLSLRLSSMQMELLGNKAIDFSAGVGKDPISEGPKMAGAFLIIFPPLVIYLIAQRWFTEGIERTGLVE
ncbi:carbohydrate ABC transporter permease [Cohnella sp. WQ 127256]|uniref:carbohydrate ABC transporter permease n=1 Tax=Cohnella sp. WQ 127256 TaxID=2938790 RepID=UPI0021199AF3|nr:carbohydrate ABC transporter permease [Cohnella sp. WQ 127256]